MNLENQKIPSTWHLRKSILDLDKPIFMGILNITPDSFSDGGLYFSEKAAMARALEIEAQGAHIIDVGAESTRPGSTPISAQEEWQRLKPVLVLLQKELNIPISVDTYKYEVASSALELGVEIINDISLASDKRLIQAVLDAKAAYVLMHNRGNSQNMMQYAQYNHFESEVIAEMQFAINVLLEFGIDQNKICLDPGFGFAKTSEQNYRLFKLISQLRKLNFPLMVALSKKRMLREIVGNVKSDLVEATIIANVLAYQMGANIFRIHDVKAHVNAFKVFKELTD